MSALSARLDPEVVSSRMAEFASSSLTSRMAAINFAVALEASCEGESTAPTDMQIRR